MYKSYFIWICIKVSVTYTFINIKSWSYLGFFEVEGVSSSSLSSVCLRLLFKPKLYNWTSSVSKPPSIPDIVRGILSQNITGFLWNGGYFPRPLSSSWTKNDVEKIRLRNSLGSCGRKQHQRQKITYLYFHK